ncbi:unnamed protein product [Musa hybrid cultivar]
MRPAATTSSPARDVVVFDEGPCADELVVAHRRVQVAAPLPLGRRRRHTVVIVGTVPGGDAAVEDADDDAFAHVGGVPHAVAAVPQPQEHGGVGGQRTVHRARVGVQEPVQLRHGLHLLVGEARREASHDVAVGVDNARRRGILLGRKSEYVSCSVQQRGVPRCPLLRHGEVFALRLFDVNYIDLRLLCTVCMLAGKENGST